MVIQLEVLRRFEKDMDWLSQHYEELARKHPEEYVAVYRQEVIDHDVSLESLMKRLNQKYGEIAKSVAIEYVSLQKQEMIL